MDFPYGDPHRGRHRREQEEEDFPPHQPPPSYANEPPPFYDGNERPPPFYGGNEQPPPFYGGNERPPPFYGGNEQPPPPYAGNEPPRRYRQSSEGSHTSHVGGPDSYRPPPPPNNDYDPPPFEDADNRHQHHPHMPHFPSFGHHQTQHGDGGGISGKPSVKVYCKAETNFALTIRDGKVLLAPSDPSDPFQHWIKDEKYSTKVKDEEGFPSFALINKATGQAMKHANGATQPVQLTPYNPDTIDESVLWTESRDLGDGYRTIRMINNIRLNVDAFNGDANHGGVHDGTTIVLWEWKKGENQRWKIAPYFFIRLLSTRQL